MLGLVVKPQNMLEFKFMNENKLSYCRRDKKVFIQNKWIYNTFIDENRLKLKGSSCEKKSYANEIIFCKISIQVCEIILP